jgi:hypothetical protein
VESITPAQVINLPRKEGIDEMKSTRKAAAKKATILNFDGYRRSGFVEHRHSNIKRKGSVVRLVDHKRSRAMFPFQPPPDANESHVFQPIRVPVNLDEETKTCLASYGIRPRDLLACLVDADTQPGDLVLIFNTEKGVGHIARRFVGAGGQAFVWGCNEETPLEPTEYVVGRIVGVMRAGKYVDTATPLRPLRTGIFQRPRDISDAQNAQARACLIRPSLRLGRVRVPANSYYICAPDVPLDDGDLVVRYLESGGFNLCLYHKAANGYAVLSTIPPTGEPKAFVIPRTEVKTLYRVMHIERDEKPDAQIILEFPTGAERCAEFKKRLASVVGQEGQRADADEWPDVTGG